MKWHAQQVTWTLHDWAHVGALDAKGRRAAKSSSAADIESAMDVGRQARSGLAGPLRIVTILAFCQTLFFLVLFLFMCAWAGAATGTKPGANLEKPSTNLELVTSTYAPQSDRDPFGSGVTESADNSAKAAASIESGMFKLNGLLYDRVRPSAIINDQLVELNKPVSVPTGQGGIEVKAVQITRSTVVLEIGDRKLELRLGGGDPDKTAK